MNLPRRVSRQKHSRIRTIFSVAMQRQEGMRRRPTPRMGYPPLINISCVATRPQECLTPLLVPPRSRRRLAPQRSCRRSVRPPECREAACGRRRCRPCQALRACPRRQQRRPACRRPRRRPTICPRGSPKGSPLAQAIRSRRPFRLRTPRRRPQRLPTSRPHPPRRPLRHPLPPLAPFPATRHRPLRQRRRARQDR